MEYYNDNEKINENAINQFETQRNVILDTLEKLQQKQLKTPLKTDINTLNDQITQYNENINKLQESFKEDIGAFNNQITRYNKNINTLQALKINFHINFLNINERKAKIALVYPHSEGFYSRSQKQHPSYIEENNSFGNKVLQYIDANQKDHIYNVGGYTSKTAQKFQIIKSQVFNKKSSKSNNKYAVALKDFLLTYKTDIVNKLIQQSKDYNNLIIDKNQTKSQYPCLIIRFKKEHSEGYAELITHIMIAKINIRLKQQHLYPLIERRQSFGFLLPTLTEVHTGVRLSIGLTPNDKWMKCVIAGIQDSDDEIEKIINNFDKDTCDENKDPLLNKFRGGLFNGDGYKYLENFYTNNNKTTNKSNNIYKDQMLDFLNTASEEYKNELQKVFLIIYTKEEESESQEELESQAKLERTVLIKNHKTRHPLNQMMPYTYYLYDETTKNLKKINVTYKNKNIEKYDETIISNISIENMNYFIRNTFDKQDNIQLSTNAEIWLTQWSKPENNNQHIIDNDYIRLYNTIINIYKQMINEPLINNPENNQSLKEQTIQLSTLQDKVTASLLKYIPKTYIDDTSDDEDSNDDKQYYTPSGMSALFAPLIAAKEVFSDNNMPFIYEVDPYAYFELALSWKKTLNSQKIAQSNIEERISNTLFLTLFHTKYLHKTKNHQCWAKFIIDQPTTNDKDLVINKNQVLFIFNADNTIDIGHCGPGKPGVYSQAKINDQILCDQLQQVKNGKNGKNILSNDNKSNINKYLIGIKSESRIKCLSMLRPLLLSADKNLESVFKKLSEDIIKILKDGSTLNLKEIIDKYITEYRRSDICSNQYPEFLEALLDVVTTVLNKFGFQCNSNDNHKNFNKELFEKFKTPQMYYIDNNPCVNKTDIPKTFEKQLQELSLRKPPPSIIVLDTTSSTQEQINNILAIFNKQDKIPILVTAASLLKNSELGLDLWQNGLNKAYISKQCDKNNPIQAKFETFKTKMKNYTESTEPGFSRVARRLLREAINTVTAQEQNERSQQIPSDNAKEQYDPSDITETKETQIIIEKNKKIKDNLEQQQKKEVSTKPEIKNDNNLNQK